MGITKFEDLLVWEKSQELAVDIYKSFKSVRDFGFKDQITRAAVSICNNIAEGFERRSQKEFARYLIIAQASNAELRSMLYLSIKLEYLDDNNAELLMAPSRTLSSMLYGLRKSVLSYTGN